MAKQLIKTINIYFDPDAVGQSAGTNAFSTDTTVNITLTPTFDPNKPELKSMFGVLPGVLANNLANPVVADSLAHELGHVVAVMTDQPAHRAMKMNLWQLAMSRLMGFNPPPEFEQKYTLPVEQEAWEIAKKINPDIQPLSRLASLATYDQSASKTMEEALRRITDRAKREGVKL